MPNLLQINVTANWGSTGRITEDIGQLVMSHGWESRIAYGRYVTESQSKLYRIGGKADLFEHLVATRLLDRHGLASRQATRRLIDYIDEVAPSIIHLHNIHGYFLNYPLLFDYLKQTNVPVVWTLHDCWAFTGHCAFFDYAKCERWKTGCHDCPQKRSYPESLFFGRSRKNYENKKRYFTSLQNLTLVPVSEWLESKVRQSFLGNCFIETIHNGIDMEVFKPSSEQNKDARLQGRCIVLGVASVWDDRKGLADFIRLRELLPKDYAIVLIGLREAQIKQLPEGIIGISRTNNRQELVDYYSMAEAFVNPTWEDTFPTTNLEALACGTPVITYRTGGSVEAVTPETGYVVDQGDIKGLASALSEIRSNGKDCYAKACRRRAVACFDKYTAYGKYLSLYQRLIDKKL